MEEREESKADRKNPGKTQNIHHKNVLVAAIETGKVVVEEEHAVLTEEGMNLAGIKRIIIII